MIKLSMIARGLFVEAKKLRIFDFDDSIVKTTSYIYIKHADGTTSKLTPGEYAVYEPVDGDEFDYSDFKTVNNPIEIRKVTKILKRIDKSIRGDKVYILTARAKYKPIKDYLKSIGIKNAHVIALGSSDPNDKADWIEDKIDNEGYDDIYFADDSIKNVNVAKKMLRTKNVKFRVQHIKEATESRIIKDII